MFDFLLDKVYFVFVDGMVFIGVGFGYCGIIIGEVVFNIGMIGYQEVLIDFFYVGQLVSFIYFEFGNIGVNVDD